MSHPENTLKEIVQRQNKKIEGLERIIHGILISYQTISPLDDKGMLMKEFDKVRKL